jgi:hypothetical protein
LEYTAILSIIFLISGLVAAFLPSRGINK